MSDDVLIDENLSAQTPLSPADAVQIRSPLALSPQTLNPQAHCDDLIEQGLYWEAFQYAEQAWGPLASWRTEAQLDVAITVLSHLGRDRDSDAVMLRAWRRYPQNVEFCVKYAFFLLNAQGPIRAELFAEQQQALLNSANDQTDHLVLQLSLQAARKNFVDAKSLLARARQLSPDSTWLDRIELMLLREQQRFDEELALSTRLLQVKPRASIVVAHARALVRNQQSAEAMRVLAHYAPQMQSCRVWSQLIHISARLMAWPQ